MEKHLRIKNFEMKPKVLDFSSVQFMTDLEKKKIYIGFVELLNNHFKWSCFDKALYQHFTSHCGFSAHYNIYRFYGEYFKTADSFHYNVNGCASPMYEYMGNVNRESSLSDEEQFYAIYKEMNSCPLDGIGAFVNTLLSNQSLGSSSAYADLNIAIKDAINEYKEIWIEEIKLVYDESTSIKESRINLRILMNFMATYSKCNGTSTILFCNFMVRNAINIG